MIIKHYIILLFILISSVGFSQKKKTEIKGVGRAFYFNNTLEISPEEDSVTSPKSNYGTTLIDLGINVFPNEKTELLGTFRISNQLGGYWGGGVDFQVRQLTLKGVALDGIRYKLGDIDLKLTEYTLFNDNEDAIANDAEIYSLMRDVNRYEMFYIDNYWRMQGGQAEFDLDVKSKIINEIQFNGFLTRQNVTDGLAIPERILGGGSVYLVNKDLLKIGYNNTSVYDISKTISDSALYKNAVNSIGYELINKKKDKISGIKGEFGISKTNYDFYSDLSAPASYGDYFTTLKVHISDKKSMYNASVGYMNVGSGFRSPSAQSKRMNYKATSSLYSIITNENVIRPLSTFDYLSLNSTNNRKISYNLQNYFQYYNNTLPYGMATPNRKGLYLFTEKNDTAKKYNINLDVYSLKEVVGEGTFEKRNFLLANLKSEVALSKFINWKKNANLNLGLRYEKTTRGGEVYETINLNSVIFDAGLTLEIQKNLDFLLATKLISSKGNEFRDVRNIYNTLNEIDPIYYNLEENLNSMGIRYRFSDDVALSFIWQKFSYLNLETDLNYGINQFFILYNMNF